MIARRIFLKDGSLAALGLSMVPGFLQRAALAAAPNTGNHKILVAIFQRGGADGLDAIRPLIAGAGELLRPGGRLVLEIGDGQREAVVKLAEATGLLVKPMVLKDHEGLWRVLVAQRA